MCHREKQLIRFGLEVDTWQIEKSQGREKKSETIFNSFKR